jgi:quinol monooxygenase YgiN
MNPEWLGELKRLNPHSACSVRLRLVARMTARILEVTPKPGRCEEVCRVAEQEILPLLRQQNGFLGGWTLVTQDEPQRIVFFSFWTTVAAAAEYERSLYAAVVRIISPLMETAPVPRMFTVHDGAPVLKRV